ncbi:Fc.00g042540.m01.CDS01 [Cosmosporella sp. VM-42]
MAPHPIVTAMVQSGALGAFANLLAQAITAFRTGTDLTIDWVPVFQFLLFNLISTPPNFLWQDFLESAFPAYPQPPHPKKTDEKSPPPQLSIRNTLIKFLLDQTIGAILNTLLFSTFTHSLRLATLPTAPITSLSKAITYWTSPGAVDFRRVDFSVVWAASKEEFWPIFVAGWKLWPAVSLVNFTLVKTVQGRNLVGALAGVVWGVYMSLISAR